MHSRKMQWRIVPLRDQQDSLLREPGENPVLEDHPVKSPSYEAGTLCIGMGRMRKRGRRHQEMPCNWLWLW